MLSLRRLEDKQKKISNLFRIRIILFLSYSFGIETINTSIPVVPSKTIHDSRPKWAKSIPIFRPKRRKTPTQWGGSYLYGLYKGVPPPPPPGTYLTHSPLNRQHRQCRADPCFFYQKKSEERG